MLINCKHEAWYPWNVDFSPRQNEENEENENFTLFARYHETLISRIGRKRIFRERKCQEFAHTKLGSCGKNALTLNTWISRLVKIAFSGLRREENYHTFRDVKRWFHVSAKILPSGTKMRKICSHEAWYIRKICSHEAWYLRKKLLPRNFWNVDFTTRQTRNFSPQKWRIFPLCARYLETLVLRIGSNRNFRLPKYRKFAQRSLLHA